MSDGMEWMLHGEPKTSATGDFLALRGVPPLVLEQQGQPVLLYFLRHGRWEGIGQ